MSKLGALLAPFEWAWRPFRRVPPAYSLGIALFVAGFALIGASLLPFVEIVTVTTIAGEAGPGTTEREVPFRSTPLFQASLAIDSCGVQFYLLNDLEYEDWMSRGRLPAPTLNCSQPEALVTGPVGHLVTTYLIAPGAPSVPYSITAAFWGEAYPYALLSLPGAVIVLGSTAWIAKTMLSRGTEKLLRESSPRSRGEKRK